jgi:predicted ferric reductase
MGLLLRAVVGSAAYLALATLPLALALVADPIARPRPFALELSVALGLVAFALFALELGLVSRLRAASEPFGTDALMLFHRQMGIAASLFALAHPLLLGRGALALANPFSGPAASRLGAASLWSAVALVLSSVLRKRLGLRYELWKGAHQLLAITVIGTMWLHVRAVGGYSSAPLVSGVTTGYSLLFVGLMLRYEVVRPLLLARRPWVVVDNRDEGASTRTLVLRPAGHRGIDFSPGQFAWLLTGRTPLLSQQHPISFSSSAAPAAERRVELSIKALGDWSGGVVPALEPGARVWLDGPFGAFTVDRAAAQGFVLIAGGIGITPMRSILLTMRDRGDRRPVVLFHAASHPRRAVFRAELQGLRSELDLRIVEVFEEPDADWAGERGRVTADVLRRHLPADLRHLEFLVCGPPGMIDGVERALLGLGVAPERLTSERFDMV